MKVHESRGKKVRLAIQAPREVRVDREKVHEARKLSSKGDKE